VISAVTIALKLWVNHLAFSLVKAFWNGFLQGGRDLKRATEREQPIAVIPKAAVISPLP
jgi:hypothetical protein